MVLKKLGKWALAVGFGSAIPIVISYWSSSTAQQAHDHATGRSVADISVVGSIPSMETIPGPFLAQSEISGQIVCFKTLHDLVEFYPRVVIKNTGAGPIGSVKIETSLPEVRAEGIDARRALEVAAMPWAKKHKDTTIYRLPVKLMPGEQDAVDLRAGLLAQMMDVQGDQNPKALYVGEFVVQIYPRLIAAEGYDKSSSVAGISVKYGWATDGFPKQECMAYIRELQTAGSAE